MEILRSCTAEPRATGIVWTVEKDITRYYSLLMTNQTLAVYLGNLVDKTYTGIYHVNISVHFYPAEENYGFSGLNIDDSANSVADLILPISRNLPLNDGLWFEIQNSTDVESKEFRIHQMCTGLSWKFMFHFMKMMNFGTEIFQMSTLLPITLQVTQEMVLLERFL